MYTGEIFFKSPSRMINFPPPPPPAPTPSGMAPMSLRHPFRVFVLAMVFLLLAATGVSIFFQWYATKKVTAQVHNSLQEAEDMQRRIQLQMQTEIEKSQNQQKTN